MPAEPPAEPSAGPFRWNAAGWFGALFGSTIWLLILGCSLFAEDVLAGTVACLGFAASALWGVTLWRRRAHLTAYSGLQAMMAGLLVLFAVVVLTTNARAPAIDLPYWAIAVPLLLMTIFWFRQRTAPGPTAPPQSPNQDSTSAEDASLLESLHRETFQGRDEFGRTSAHYAALGNLADHLAQLLDQDSTALDAQDAAGWTPLHFAASNNAAECVRLLLDRGAKVDIQDAHGNSPLWRATFASQGNGTVIAALRAAGADPRLINRHGVSPVGLARTIDNYPIAQFFTDVTE
jgi:hypothetical protein